MSHQEVTLTYEDECNASESKIYDSCHMDILISVPREQQCPVVDPVADPNQDSNEIEQY